MKAIQNAAGHVGLTARSYPIASGTAVKRGQVVKLSGGKVVLAAVNETGALLGIAAENHSGSADALDIRSNGGEILVYDSPELIFDCPAPEIVAATGSATTVVAASGEVDSTIANDAFNGGMLKLKSKASSSTNTDALGMLMEVTDYTASGLVFTKGSGGVSYAGDVYQLFPPVGSKVCALNSGISAAVVDDTGCTSMKVVGWDLEMGRVRLMAALHSLGVEE